MSQITCERYKTNKKCHKLIFFEQLARQNLIKMSLSRNNFYEKNKWLDGNPSYGKQSHIPE